MHRRIIIACQLIKVDVIFTHLINAFLSVLITLLASFLSVVICRPILAPLLLKSQFFLCNSIPLSLLLLHPFIHSTRPIKISNNTQYKNTTPKSGNKFTNQSIIRSILKLGRLINPKIKINTISMFCFRNHIDKGIVIHFISYICFLV